MNDAVGSVRTTTDTAGVVGSQTAYTAFGEPIVPATGFGFAGEQQDPTGLQHLRARQYNPALGRFLSVDPIQPGAPGTTGWGLYGYAGSNPTTATDPSGLVALTGYVGQAADSADSSDVLATSVSNCANSGLVMGFEGLSNESLPPDPARAFLEDCGRGAVRAYGSSLFFFGLGQVGGHVLRNADGSLDINSLDRLEVDRLAREAADSISRQADELGHSVPTITTIAIDRKTGAVYAGLSNGNVPRPDVPSGLTSVLDDVTPAEKWAVDNCGEVGACINALSGGASFDDLSFYSIYTDTGRYRELCNNCVQWADAIFPELRRGS